MATNTLVVLAIREGKIHKDKKKPRGAKGKDKVKNKLAYDHKPKISPPPKRDNSTKDSVCHHCKEGLRESKKLKHGALSLYMGNGMCAAVEAIGSFNLIIPSGLIIVLDNCHFTPSVTRGVVSSPVWDGIYEIDMHNLYPNVSSIFNVSNKRAKHALDSSYLWHCHLGHINKKRMDKLQCDGILQPTHDESLKKCKTVSEGASYFITFTDDFSRYGYVYLMKHKHEVFETFKVFQNEVENQLGKKIKAIQSDRGDEYPSHEFVNHMKTCGIVSQLTPPYTPQHNGVSERRNQNLLDMVRSMMNLTTLPKSFWGYALKSNQDVRVGEEKEGKEGFQKINKVLKVFRDLNEPSNYKAVLSDPEFDKWLEAMNTKMQSMKDNQVWVLVDLPPNGQTLGNYGETFSSVADIRAIRILLAIAAFYDYENCQMDVKIAFLNSHLSEDVYMVQPEGFVDPKHPNKVCKLQRSIYELKQASRSWNKRFDVKIKKIGFTQNSDEPCVYLKASGSNVAFLILYVNDILLMGNNVTMLQEVKSWLCKCFSMKDLGKAAYILGIKIIRDRSKRLIALSQSAYLEKILKKFWMENSKKGYTLMIEKPDYRKSQGAKTPSEVQRMQRVPYASVIGSIMYAVRCTRPDVAFAQNLCSRFQQNPGEIHWTAVKAILKYLRNTKDMVLVYGAKPEAELKVSCYADASFQTDKDDTKSQMRYVFVLNGGSMDWKSAKQSTNAMSSTESEYIDADEALMEVVWMINLLMDLEMSCHRIKDIWRLIQERKIVLKKVHTDDNVANPLTKPMPFNKHYEHARAIGIVPASISGSIDDVARLFVNCLVPYADADVDSFKRCGTSYTFDVRYSREAFLFDMVGFFFYFSDSHLLFYIYFFFYEVFGRHLEEIHVTWTQFRKKRDKIATLHEDEEELAYSA
ncbi:retrotransposon protein, putative, ty1-copia subclass [Tanacetum coccineum]